MTQRSSTPQRQITPWTTLADPSTAELLESVLVRVDNIQVSSTASGGDVYVANDGFRVGNTLYDHGLSVGETVSIIGVLDYTFSEFVLLPGPARTSCARVQLRIMGAFHTAPVRPPLLDHRGAS